MTDETARDLGKRVTAIAEQLAGVNRGLDRIERRLDLVEG